MEEGSLRVRSKCHGARKRIQKTKRKLEHRKEEGFQVSTM